MTVTALADLEVALVRAVTTAELAFAQQIIDHAEADVLEYLPGYDLAPTSTETVALTGAFNQPLTLPRYPVTAVSAVTVDGVSLVAGEWSWAEDGYLDRAVLAGATGSYMGTGWGYPTGVVGVTYTHGQGAAPLPLVRVIAAIAASRLSATTPAGLKQRDIGPFSEQYDPAGVGSPSLTDDEMSALRRFRRVAGPIRLVSGASL